MNHSFGFALAAVFGIFAFTAPTALAADPKLDAQVQLGSAFSKCDDKDAGGYFEQRDFAFSVDPTLKGWGGTIARSQKKYPVQATVARCDKEMAVSAAKAKRESEVQSLFRALESACYVNEVDAAAWARYKAARAALVAKAGNEDPEGIRAKCDAAIVKQRAEEQKAKAEEAAREAKFKADAERARIAREKHDAMLAKLNASIGGDRKKILETRFWPHASIDQEERWRNAPVWSYDEDVYMGSIAGARGSLEATARCTTSFHFSGDKLVKTTKSGPGCR
jgi:hypothetical protein